MPELKGSLGGHAFRRMLEERISVSINTDNRTVSNTTMVNELKIAVETFAMTPKQLKEIVINGFKRSFFCRPYCEKRKFVRQVRPAPAARCALVLLFCNAGAPCTFADHGLLRPRGGGALRRWRRTVSDRLAPHWDGGAAAAVPGGGGGCSCRAR